MILKSEREAEMYKDLSIEEFTEEIERVNGRRYTF